MQRNEAHAYNDFTGDEIWQRHLAYRALADMAMNTMDELNRVNGDLLRKQTAEETRKLLDVELNASKATGIYCAKCLSEEDAEDGLQNHSFRLGIPEFGTFHPFRRHVFFL